MRNAKLTILASLSLVTLAVLAFGYVANLGLTIEHVSVTPSGKTVRAGWAGVGGAQFHVGRQRSATSQPFAEPAGLHLLPVHSFEPSLAFDWLGGFHIYRFSGAPNLSGVGLVCPLWFAALPFTIAPIAWLRRRRRRDTRGFAVEGKEPVSEPASEQPNQPPELPTNRQTPTGV